MKRLWQGPAAALLGLSVCAAAGFAYAVSHLAPYDDEGLLLYFIRRVLAGDPSYDRVHTIYGPFYYANEWAAHALIGIPLSHDSVRFVSLAFGIASAALLCVLLPMTAVLAACSSGGRHRRMAELGRLTGHLQHLPGSGA